MTSMRYVPSAIVAATLIFLSTACGGVSDPSSNSVQDFMATISPGEVRTHEFDVSKRNGEYSVTITAMTPDPATVLTMYLGQIANSACTAVSQPTFAVLNRIALSGFVQQGHYCIAVYDSQGLVTRPETYTLHVSHP